MARPALRRSRGTATLAHRHLATEKLGSGLSSTQQTGGSGVRFYSHGGACGYGLAGVSYVRGLVKAGVRVEWIPLVQPGWEARPLAPGEILPLLAVSADDASMSDLQALIAATSRPVRADTVVVHYTPENWKVGFDSSCRNLGFTAWEADRLPPHWLPLLSQAHAVCVPCEANRKAMAISGVHRPMYVVPHVHRGVWNEFEPAELEAFRAQLGIPTNHFVFYTIGTWDPRKDIPSLMRAYAKAFTQDQPVTMIVKTAPIGNGAPPYFHTAQTAQLATQEMAKLASHLGRELPPICLLPYELSGRGVDLLHALGDCYVSLSHGEAWGLGAFDAATRGTPVIMTGWGGQLDFLGEKWRGNLPFKTAHVPVYPPERPSFWPPQRWAVADETAAVEMLRDILSSPGVWRREAKALKMDILRRFSEEAVIPRLLDAIRG